MNWILGLIGAVFGAAMAGERGLFGAVAGFLLVYLLGSLAGLKSRLQRSESDLRVRSTPRAKAPNGVRR